MTGGEAADKLADRLAALSALSREELAERWATLYGCPAPPGVRRELLAHAAAWHIQAKAVGGLSADMRKLLKRAVGKVERCRTSTSTSSPPAADAIGAAVAEAATITGTTAGAPAERRGLSPGARLMRDWNGRTHVVDVVENGFLHDGKTHRSLSAIAKLITGAHWSGPRFFGL